MVLCIAKTLCHLCPVLAHLDRNLIAPQLEEHEDLDEALNWIGFSGAVL